MNVGVFDFDHVVKMGKNIKSDAKLDWIAGKINIWGSDVVNW